ncbi:MAG: exodeoxyribonuclease VII small subunit [Phycisphaerales bacterium]
MAKRTTSDRGNASEPLPEEIASMGYEEAITALEALIDQIEQGEIGLEASIAEYRRGVQLLRRCEAVLSAAESQVKELTLTEVEAAGEDAGSERER